VAVGRLASLKTSSLIGINTNISLYLSSGHLSDVTVTVTNQGLDQAKYFIGISSGSLVAAKDSDYIIFNKPLERNGSVSLNVGIKSGDLIFCRASKQDVTFLAFSTQDYSSRISSSYGRENSIKITDSGIRPNTNITLFTSTKNSKVTLSVENNNFDSAFISAGISSGEVSQFGAGDYLFYAKNLAPKESYILEDIGIGVNQSLIVRSSKTDVKFAAFSVPAIPTEEIIISSLSPSGGISTTGGDLFVGGDLYVKDDVKIQELTANNFYVTGISTITTVNSSTVNSSIGNIVSGLITSVSGRNLNYTGISTFAGPVLVGSGTSTNTESQPLQITGGVYISGNTGIGSTNPQYKLDVVGDVRLSGVVSATSLSGPALTSINESIVAFSVLFGS
jgi:hypothetical protein